MITINYKRFVRAKISDKKFRQILRSFALDLTATQIASLTRLNRNTVNRYLTFIRQAIARFCEQEFPFSGDIELDESRLSVQSVFAVAVAVEHLVKPSSSASTNVTVKFIPRLSPMSVKTRFCK